MAHTQLCDPVSLRVVDPAEIFLLFHRKTLEGIYCPSIREPASKFREHPEIEKPFLYCRKGTSASSLPQFALFKSILGSGIETLLRINLPCKRVPCVLPVSKHPCTTVSQRAHQKDPDRDPRVE